MSWGARSRWLAASGLITLAWTGVGAPSGPGAYPAEPITVVVPAPPGGGLDIQARLLAPVIRRYLPQPTTVTARNHPGAGTKIGLLRVFDAKPDGYTIGLVPSSVPAMLHVTNQLEGRDPRTLTYLARIGYSPYLLARSVRGRFASVEEMKGQEVRFGGPAGMRVQAALMARLLGVRMVYITYDGVPEAALAAMRGDLDLFLPIWNSGIKHVELSEGKVVPLFVTANARLSRSLDIPTAREFGLPLRPEEAAMLASATWVVAPPGLPEHVAAVLRDAVLRAVSDPELEAQMLRANYTTRPVLSPDETMRDAMLTYEAHAKHRDLLIQP
jgi:tripartite-type tricarboxylate transporter receptor subunit TctC